MLMMNKIGQVRMGHNRCSQVFDYQLGCSQFLDPDEAIGGK